MYINTTNGAYPVSEADIRAAAPSTSFPDPFVPPSNFKWVFPTPRPEHNPATQGVAPAAPVLTVLGQYEQRWTVTELFETQEERDAALAADQLVKASTMQKAIVEAMTDLFDTTAQARRYDNRITCALRAGYPGPFQEEGQAFAMWMDECNALGYTMLAEVQAGTRPMPATVGEALALLPEMVWPV